MGLVRGQLVWDYGDDVEYDVVAEVAAAVEREIKRVLARASRRKLNLNAVGGWTAPLAQELVDRLSKRGRSVQVATLAYEAHNGGFAPRAVVYALGRYMADRRLNGFTKPSNAIMREMIEEGLL